MQSVPSIPLDDRQFVLGIITKIRRRADGYDCRFELADMERITSLAVPALLKDKTLIDIQAPIYVCGDLHGNIDALLFILSNGWPPHSRYLFLGDYVDRGRRGIEVMTLLLALKIMHPDCVYLLRGNHEDAEMNVSMMKDGYSFKTECCDRYNKRAWQLYMAVFPYIPLCALINQAILCTHGGIPKPLTSFDTVRELRRPIFNIPDGSFVCDLLWADPSDEIDDWDDNEDRGISRIFGERALRKFFRRFDIDLVIRGHEEVERGVSVFGGEQRLITVFSSHNYCDGTNSAGVVRVGANLEVALKEFRPQKIRKWLWTTVVARRQARAAMMDSKKTEKSVDIGKNTSIISAEVISTATAPVTDVVPPVMRCSCM